MSSRKKHSLKQQSAMGIVPFQSAEEAWFWFIGTLEARQDGARISGGHATIPRPCEPVDILKVVDRLYRQRRLMRDHIMVLKHYGDRRIAPDYCRPLEMRSHKIWHEALARLEVALETKGIVCRPRRTALNDTWFAGEGVAAE